MDHLFLNFDKAGAEWVVVAYLSGDARMLDVVQSGKSPHVVTGSLISGAPEELVQKEHELIGERNNPYEIEELRASLPDLRLGSYFLPRTMSIRQAGKKSNHALNYGEGYRVFALYNEMEEGEAKKIVEFYHTRAYPGVRRYHDGIKYELRENGRTLTNCFGRKVVLRGPWDDHLFKKGYSFKPQSTVVDMVNKGMVLAYEDEGFEMWDFLPLSQVHDSLLVMVPVPMTLAEWRRLAAACQKMDRYMSPTCVYGAHSFKIKTDVKIGTDYQHMEKVKLIKDLDGLARELQTVWEQMNISPEPMAGDPHGTIDARAVAAGAQ
jgi:DNA polymerase family A